MNIHQALSSENNFWALNGDQTHNLLMTGDTLRLLTYQDSDGKLSCKFEIYVT